eukprot:GHVO01029411.1.p1 GENE.GHVO01029411.1~~GHVO01029411.1.p1  ORF type:complete len:242 (+),score=52.10 GHVO01029411.1:26-727(+)
MPEIPDSAGYQTIIAFGSLLSKVSAQCTFTDVRNFRLGRLKGYRRVFSQPAPMFLERGIADLKERRMCSLAAWQFPKHFPEAEEGEDGGMIISIFEIPKCEIPAFYEREEEFDIIEVSAMDMETCESVRGLFCGQSSDEAYIERHGEHAFKSRFQAHGVDSIWDMKEPSYPCSTYCRHCVLSASSHGDEVLNDFLDTTYLWDKKTKLRKYLDDNPWVLDVMPPESLKIRYGGK